MLRPGLLTTVQDLGRWGQQGNGVPVAGPMDVYSHRLANQLVGNSELAAALEITLAGPELQAEGDMLCAVAGADFSLVVGGHGIHHTGAFRVQSGTTIRFRERRSGARGTLAVRGGIAVPETFASRSTSVLSRMGPFGGRALLAGDRLPVGQERTSTVQSRGRIRWRCRAVEPASASSSVPTSRASHAAAFETLFSNRFIVTPSSNRMGYRLEGPAADACVRRGHPVGRHTDRLASGARIGTTDPADGRSTDDRRLPEDRDRHHRGSSRRRPARARRLDGVRAVPAGRRRSTRFAHRSVGSRAGPR